MAENKVEKKESRFGVITVQDCMDEGIDPRDILSNGQVGINLSWTQLIALINRKHKKGKVIQGTDIPAFKIGELYGEMASTPFL